jgi:antitoxin VapB
MALNIKDSVTEQLAAEVAELAGETKTGAIRVALAERLERLRAQESREDRAARIRRVLEEEIWPLIPPEVLDQPPMTKAEREEILGIGPEGY